VRRLAGGLPFAGHLAGSQAFTRGALKKFAVAAQLAQCLQGQGFDRAQREAGEAGDLEWSMAAEIRQLQYVALNRAELRQRSQPFSAGRAEQLPLAPKCQNGPVMGVAEQPSLNRTLGRVEYDCAGPHREVDVSNDRARQLLVGNHSMRELVTASAVCVVEVFENGSVATVRQALAKGIIKSSVRVVVRRRMRRSAIGGFQAKLLDRTASLLQSSTYPGHTLDKHRHRLA